MSDTGSGLQAMRDRVFAVLDGLRRWLVAGLVLLHIIAITLLAFPSPGGGLNRKDWQNRTVQAEFASWNERLRPLGWTGTSEELQDEIFVLAKAYAGGLNALKKPFDPYYKCCGTYQSWRMFVAPHRFPSRFQIRILEGGDWRVVYEARHPEHRWLGSVLDNDRMRSGLFRYGWGRKYPREYKALGDWIAVRARRDFPGATRLQLRFANYKTPTPEQVRAGFEPEITWHRPRTLTLRDSAPGNR